MQFGERRWPQAKELAERVVVLPLGSLEQHGLHLPLLTDTMIISEIAQRAEAELGDTALFLPTLWLGASDHHRGFPGTVSVSNDHYVQIMEDILESLMGAGFRRIFLLNGHGGNLTPGRLAIYNVQLRHRDKPELYIALSCWWTLADEQIASIAELDSKKVTHACELESSMILRLRPELVDMKAARGVILPFESAFYHPDFQRASRVDVPRAFDQLSATGAFGHPERATPQKGEALFAAAVGEVVAFLREFAAWPAVDPA
jgi:creatinine amidohydrolase